VEGGKIRFSHNACEILVLNLELTEVYVSGGGYDWTGEIWFPGALLRLIETYLLAG